MKTNATATDVRGMSVGEAKAIYRKRYWDAQRYDELPARGDYPPPGSLELADRSNTPSQPPQL